MTNTEQQFFEVFGIEPQKLCFNGDCAEKDEIGYNEKICNDRCVYIEREYPEITAEKLLKIMVIYSKDFVFSVQNEENIETLKRDVLRCAIDCAKYKKYAHLKKQVRALFERGKE